MVVGVSVQKLIKEFYELSKKDRETKYVYPEIVPEVMSSLTELLSTRFYDSRCYAYVFTSITNQIRTDFLHQNPYQLKRFLFQNYYEQSYRAKWNVLETLNRRMISYKKADSESATASLLR